MWPKYLIFELLALRRPRPEERAARVDEVRPREVEVPIDQEVLLLRPAGRRDALGFRAEEPQNADGLLRQRVDRAEEGRLRVERLAGPAHERGRNHERRAVLADEEPRRARRIPRRVAARFERGAHAAGREARGVGLALDQFLAAELRDRAAFRRRRDERIVLLGGDAGERLEPVRVVGRAVFDRPVFHRGGDDVGDRRVERLSLGDGAPKRFVGVARQAAALDVVVERQGSEDLGGLRPRLRGFGAVFSPIDDALCRVVER